MSFYTNKTIEQLADCLIAQMNLTCDKEALVKSLQEHDDEPCTGQYQSNLSAAELAEAVKSRLTALVTEHIPTEPILLELLDHVTLPPTNFGNHANVFPCYPPAASKLWIPESDSVGVDFGKQHCSSRSVSTTYVPSDANIPADIRAALDVLQNIDSTEEELATAGRFIGVNVESGLVLVVINLKETKDAMETADPAEMRPSELAAFNLWNTLWRRQVTTSNVLVRSFIDTFRLGKQRGLEVAEETTKKKKKK